VKRLLALLLCAAFLFLSVSCAKENPAPSLPHEITVLKENGYLNEFTDKKVTHGGVTLQVNSIAGDGLTTYVHLSVAGELPPGIPLPDSNNANPATGSRDRMPQEDADFMFGGNSGGGRIPSYTNFAENNIKDVHLSADGGKTWRFAHQFQLGFTGDPSAIIRPTLSVNEKDAILIFYGTELAETAALSLEFEVRAIAEKFVFEGLSCKFPPVQTREFSQAELRYDAPRAKLQLLSMKSSLLETIVTIQWDLSPNFSSGASFFDEQQIVFDWGEDSFGAFMFYPDEAPVSKDKNIVLTRSHSIARAIPLDKEIKVYAADTVSREKTVDMFVIPPL